MLWLTSSHSATTCPKSVRLPSISVQAAGLIGFGAGSASLGFSLGVSGEAAPVPDLPLSSPVLAAPFEASGLELPDFESLPPIEYSNVDVREESLSGEPVLFPPQAETTSANRQAMNVRM